MPSRIRVSLKALREAAGVPTASDASALVLVNRRSWLRWENGDKPVPVGVIKRFCAITGLDPDQWIPKEEP
jgi:hypothetical protein